MRSGGEPVTQKLIKNALFFTNEHQKYRRIVEIQSATVDQISVDQEFDF